MPIDSKARVFVSHATEDKPFVRELVEALKGQNLNVWLDEEELQVGDSIVAGVSQGLKNADYLVAVLSKASVGSRWVQAELNATLMEELSGKGVTVLPVLIEDCNLPTLLKDRVYADFRHDFNAGLQKLLAVFEQEGKFTTNVAPEIATKAAPCSQKLSAITPADLRRRIATRMDRTEVGALWYAVLETVMENDMAGRQLSECVIGLLDKAKSRNKLTLVIEEICRDRPELADPQGAHRILPAHHR
jgi:TIR domain